MRRQTLLAAFLGLGLVGGIAVMAQRLHATDRGGLVSRPSVAYAQVPAPVEPELAPVPGPVPLPAVPGPPTEPPLASAPADALPPPQDRLAPASEPAPREQQPNDPMADLKAFHQQSRQKAEDQIKSLTKEAETLRARLKKVEAALEGWKAVSTALEQEPGEKPVLSVRRGFRRHAEDSPTDLSPAPIESTPDEPLSPSVPPQAR